MAEAHREERAEHPEEAVEAVEGHEEAAEVEARKGARRLS